MTPWRAAGIVVILSLLHHGFASAQARASRVFLLEDAAGGQWCAFTSEAAWKTAVQETGSTTVGGLIYTRDTLSEIDVTETDETGDWIVYDEYSVTEHGQPFKLTRMINVLPGDRSARQVFVIIEGKAKKTSTTAEQLSTGKRLNSLGDVWLPDLPIITDVKMFPFLDLLSKPSLRSSPRLCVHAAGKR